MLVEGRSKKSQQLEEDGKPIQMVGRTDGDRIVVFEGNDRQAGQILPVTIFETTPFTMFGTVVTEHVGPEVFSI